MTDLISGIVDQLLDLRDKYWELDCKQPFWLWLGIRWCLSWLSFHGERDE